MFPDTFDLAAAAAVWDVEMDAAQDWLSELVRYSLVDWDESPPARACTIWRGCLRTSISAMPRDWTVSSDMRRTT